MAVKTTFSDADFTSILAGYSLGAYRVSQPVGTGTVQTNYFLQTERGKYVFRYYENRSKESVRFECNLIAYLKRRNYPCPAPQKDKQGQYVGILREKPYVLFEFIKGEHLEHPGAAQKSQLIQKVAELQNLTRHYRPASRRARWNYGPALCRNLAEQAAQKINTENACQKLAWYLNALAQLELPWSLPKGIGHCDFHFSNILFKDGQFAALIDFDDANYTYLAFDLVTLMNPFIPEFEWDTWMKFKPGEASLDLREARAVVAEYQRYRPLRPIERRHLFDLVKLSVLIDCLWYFERGDVSDFFEKRKIDALDAFGREEFYEMLFS